MDHTRAFGTSTHGYSRSVASFVLHRNVLGVRIRRHDRLRELQTRIIPFAQIDTRRMVPDQIHRQLYTDHASRCHQHTGRINTKLRCRNRCRILGINQALLTYRAVSTTAVSNDSPRTPTFNNRFRHRYRRRYNAVLRKRSSNRTFSLRVEQTEVILILPRRLDAGEHSASLEPLGGCYSAAVNYLQICIV